MIAYIVLLLITRFIQLLGVIAVLSGISLAEPLFEYLYAMRAGEPWTIGELCLRMVQVSGPCYFGGFMVVGMQYFWRTLRMLERREKQFPREPWRWNPKWATNRIQLDNRAIFGILAFFWGMFVFIMLPAGLYMASIKLAAAIYAFVGVFGLILVVMSKNSWKNRRWNRSELIMGTMPGVIGGPFRAVAILPEVFPEDTMFRVQLKCIRKTTSGNARKKSTTTSLETLWQKEEIIGRQMDSGTQGTTAIPIAFAIPYECSPTKSANRVSVEWVLVVKLRSENDVREAAFPVPVFRTPESSASYQLDEVALRPYFAKMNAEAILNRLGMHRERQINGGERISFAIRPPGVLGGLVLLLLMCTAAIVASFVWLTGPVVFFAALLPAVLFVCGLWGLVDTLFWTSTLTIDTNEVTIESGYTGFLSTAKFLRSEGTSTSSAINTLNADSTTSGDSAVPFNCQMDFQKTDGEWWSICVPHSDGKLKPLIKRFDGRNEAEAVCKWLIERTHGRETQS